jgi:hypothetical protein
MFRDGQIIDDNIQPDRLEQFNFYEAESTARSPV